MHQIKNKLNNKFKNEEIIKGTQQMHIVQPIAKNKLKLFYTLKKPTKIILFEEFIKEFWYFIRHTMFLWEAMVDWTHSRKRWRKWHKSTIHASTAWKQILFLSASQWQLLDHEAHNFNDLINTKLCLKTDEIDLTEKKIMECCKFMNF